MLSIAWPLVACCLLHAGTVLSVPQAAYPPAGSACNLQHATGDLQHATGTLPHVHKRAYTDQAGWPMHTPVHTARKAATHWSACVAESPAHHYYGPTPSAYYRYRDQLAMAREAVCHKPIALRRRKRSAVVNGRMVLCRRGAWYHGARAHDIIAEGAHDIIAEGAHDIIAEGAVDIAPKGRIGIAPRRQIIIASLPTGTTERHASHTEAAQSQPTAAPRRHPLEAARPRRAEAARWHPCRSALRACACVCVAGCLRL